MLGEGEAVASCYGGVGACWAELLGREDGHDGGVAGSVGCLYHCIKVVGVEAWKGRVGIWVVDYCLRLTRLEHGRS